jgi:hypothetical protein
VNATDAGEAVGAGRSPHPICSASSTMIPPGRGRNRADNCRRTAPPRQRAPRKCHTGSVVRAASDNELSCGTALIADSRFVGPASGSRCGMLVRLTRHLPRDDRMVWLR